MKKSIFILLLLAVTVTIQAQATLGDFAAHEITIQLDAYELNNGITDGGEYKAHTLIIDDFYDFQLVKSKINRMINEYSDLEYVDAWRWVPEHEYFACVIEFIGMNVFVGYSEITQSCVVMYDKRHGEERL